MAPSAEPSLIPDARSLSGFQLPPWTRADESDDETISSSSRRRRRLHRRVRRRDTVTIEPTEPNVALGSIKPRYDTPVIVPVVEDHYSSDSDGQDSGYDTSDADDGKHKDKDYPDHGDDNHHKATTVAVPSATSEATISADRDPSLVSVSELPFVVAPMITVSGPGPLETTTSTTVTVAESSQPLLRPPPSTDWLTFPRVAETTSTSTSTTVITETEPGPTEETRPSSQGSSTTSSATSTTRDRRSTPHGLSSKTSMTTSSPPSHVPVSTTDREVTSISICSTDPRPPMAMKSATTGALNNADPLKSTSSSRHPSDQRNIPIVVGSIVGVFVLLAICLIGWKLCRRSRRKSTGEDWIFDKPSRRSRLMAKFPMLRKHFGHQEWYNIPEPVFQEPDRAASQKEAHMDSAPSSRRSEYFAPEKPKSVRVSTDSLRRLAVRSYASRRSVQDTSALSGDTAVNTIEPAAGATVTRHVPNQSISSIEAQYNNTMTFQQRQTMLSEMSSLSSGFGDGDIIMPPPAVATTRSPHISWRSSRGADRRDTVYTEASEDMQPRFRTVNSWVRQQTGRVRKAAQGKDAPPVPELPPEQEFGMMMPDGEVPRRVESTMMGKIKEVKEGE